MQTYLFAAGVLTLVVGAIHSVVGEILIFRHVRIHGLVPAMGAPPGGSARRQALKLRSAALAAG